MTIYVDGPDGHTVEFDDGTPASTIKAVMAKHFGAPKTAAAPKDPHDEEIERQRQLIQQSQAEREHPLEAYGETIKGAVDAVVGDVKRQFTVPKNVGELAERAFDATNPTHGVADALSAVTAPFIGGPGAVVERATRYKMTPDQVERLAKTRAALPPVLRDVVAPIPKGLDPTEALTVLGPEMGAGEQAAYRAKMLGGAGTAAKAAPEAAGAAREAAAAAGKPQGPTKPTAPPLPSGTPAERYRARVDRLTEAGVELTPGQIKGGEARRQEEAHKSHPLWGKAVREAENKSIVSFNRAEYNQALEPLGQKITAKELPDDMIGREGVDLVGKKIGAVYERIIPKMRAKPDHELVEALSEIKEDGGLLGPYESTLNHIIDQRVVKRMQSGEMDGREVKRLESELSYLARQYGSSQDGAQKLLADHIERVQAALHDNMERHSDPSVREELKKANQAWAGYVRLRGAAANRASSGGVFTVGDLLSAIKREDKSPGKGSFARGDAMLQDLAEDANAVIPNRLPDSGTPERLARNRMAGGVGAAVGGGIGGIPGAAAGWAAGEAVNAVVPPVTNRLAAMAIRERRAAALQPGSSRNYLKGATQRVARAAQAGAITSAITSEQRRNQEKPQQ